MAYSPVHFLFCYCRFVNFRAQRTLKYYSFVRNINFFHYAIRVCLIIVIFVFFSSFDCFEVADLICLNAYFKQFNVESLKSSEKIVFYRLDSVSLSLHRLCILILLLVNLTILLLILLLVNAMKLCVL